MRNALSLFATLAAIAVVGAGCATPLEVAFEDGEDLSPYRTWSWASATGPRVEAPKGEAAALEARVRRYIEQQLAAKGFRRTRSGADFLVGYQLSLVRRSVVELQPRAPYLLSSHSWSASYVVEGSDAVTRVYEAMHLAIRAGRGPAEAQWHAELTQNGEDTFSLTLQEAVARLLERFPRQGACGVSSQRPGADSAGSDGGSEADPRCPTPRAPRPSPSRFPADSLG